MASRRPTWLLGLLKAVRAQQLDLLPSKMPPKHYEALLGVAESYQRQLTLTLQLTPADASGRTAIGSGANSIRPGPAAARFGMPSPDALLLGSRGLPTAQQRMADSAPLPPLRGGPAFAAPASSYPDPGFWGGGVNAMRTMTADELPPYPSQDTAKPTLHVTSRLGPTILAHYLSTGRDMEHHVRTNMMAWKSASNKFSTHTYAEALNLARCLHIMILEQGSPRNALVMSAVPEVMLRRLYALMESERMVNVDGIARAQAWTVVGQLLEHNVDGMVSENPLNKIMQHEFNAQAKFQANARQLGKADGPAKSASEKKAS